MKRMPDLITPDSFGERHYRTRDLAEQWGVSADTIIAWFDAVPGVLKFGNKGGRGARRRLSLRIPESIARKVYAEKTR